MKPTAAVMARTILPQTGALDHPVKKPMTAAVGRAKNMPRSALTNEIAKAKVEKMTAQ